MNASFKSNQHFWKKKCHIHYTKQRYCDQNSINTWSHVVDENADGAVPK